eukprot:TRINITY_DN58_c0_g1_i14.p1 TRINITY_DN58_c0_g1~~TRINITY_DN58_c0_g1_i14.p1  ORF type:complete len:441 (-),score=142.01 TRINITY_DN58_c0_g1_i14:291-1496(-)
MEKKPVADALSGKKAVALYFSAHWCPPCRGFTPKLAAWYKENLSAKGLEVVFVSSDKDEGQFKDYFGEMPWLALPYSERAKKDALSKKFKVNGIPALVILDADGKTITTDGRAAVSGDPKGNDFPWTPVPTKDMLAGAKIIKAGGESISIADAMNGKKALALYFSAHWCPPCRGFTPQLAEWYKKDLNAKGMECIFVSSDKSEDQFKEYFAEQPWLALDYSERGLKEKLSNKFGVRGIPSLVILDADLNTVTTDGRGAVTSDPTGADMPWFPKPVQNLKAGPGGINETTTLIVFCEHSDDATKKSFEDILTPIAEQYIAKGKEKDEDPELAFMIVTDSEGLAPRIRGMVGIEDVKEPRMILLDIPDNGGYYVNSDGVVTKEAIETFISEYKNEELRRKQLG